MGEGWWGNHLSHLEALKKAFKFLRILHINLTIEKKDSKNTE